MKVAGLIPARYASTRLPAKPLASIGGKPMIVHVCERAAKVSQFTDLIVLTEDERVKNTVEEFGYRALITSADCRSGTDRISEFANRHPEYDFYVNVQGDEVTLNPTHIDQLITAFTQLPNPQMGTIAHWERDHDVLRVPSTVKVVTDQQNNALYFSRHCIPINQDGSLPEKALLHIGVYIYQRDTLSAISALPMSSLEAIEKLEQLRALQSGVSIHVVTVDDYRSLAVDTPADLEKAQMMFGP